MPPQKPPAGEREEGVLRAKQRLIEVGEQADGMPNVLGLGRGVNWIRRHPWSSITAALGAGVAVGRVTPGGRFLKEATPRLLEFAAVRALDYVFGARNGTRDREGE